MSATQTLIPLTDASQVGEARRAAMLLADRGGFGETQAGKAAIVVTELANNLVRHARGGEILLRVAEAGNGRSLETMSVDRGPGMEDVARCMRDGYSTGGTSGTGLGAVRRLSTDFAIHSDPAGTIVCSRVAADPYPSAPFEKPPFQWGAISVPAPRETACGDTWRLASREGMISLMIVDGLGHGPLAAEAAALAAGAFDQDPFVPPDVFIQAAHVAMQGSRGAAIALAQVDKGSRSIRFAGVGNISGSLVLDQGGRGLASHNGTAGVQLRKVQVFEYALPASGLLVMHSDGIQGRWALEKYPGMKVQHPAIIAAVLYRDFCRGPDDATVVVLRVMAE